MSELNEVEDWVAGMTARLSGTERAALSRILAKDLATSQRRRIAAQTDPDGQPFTPRKAPPRRLRGKAGEIKRGAMFKKLRLAKRLKVLVASGDEATVGFTGRNAAIANEHQDGASVRVGSATVRYPQRRLLGFTDADREQLLERVLAHLGGI